MYCCATATSNAEATFIRHFTNCIIDPEDFSDTQVPLLFNEQTAKACAEIPIKDDNTTEETEKFGVLLSFDNPGVTSTRPMAEVTVIDDDNVTIGFEREVYPVREGDGVVEVCARLMEGSLGRSVSIVLLTRNGSATAPEDYSAAAESVALVFGESTAEVQCVNVSLENDEVLEGVEMFEVVLDSGDEERVTLSPERAVVVITDDDGKTL